MADMIWVPFGLLAGVFVVAAWLIFLGLNTRRIFREVAELLALRWDPTGLLSPGELSGTMDGYSLEVYMTTRGGGSFQRVVTVVEAELGPPLPVEFTLRRENLLTAFARSAGVHDIEFDDPAFDDIYIVEAEDADAVRRVLSPRVRRSLVEFADNASDLRVTPTRVRWEQQGRVADTEELRDAITGAIKVARALRSSTQIDD